MDLRTEYLGLQLPHPFIVGASPFSDTLDAARRAEDGGAAAIVMRSLFQEQIDEDALASHHATDVHADSHYEASGYFSIHDAYAIGPERYLERIQALKAALAVPVIASLNGANEGGWLRMARDIASAGADALEINLYDVTVDPGATAGSIESRDIRIVESLAGALAIPLAVKIAPAFTALPHFAAELERAGARGLVLFNRLYEPDIDIDALEWIPRPPVSTPGDLYLRLRWLSILSSQTPIDLAVSGGVHDWRGAAKAVMCGAAAVQIVSAVYAHGTGFIARMRDELAAWMTEREYESLRQMRGTMNLASCPDPHALMRNTYRHAIGVWNG